MEYSRFRAFLRRRRMVLRIAAAALVVAACATVKSDDSLRGSHHTAEGFRNNDPHPSKQSFLRWKWEQWRDGVPPPVPAGGWAIPRVATDVAALKVNRSRPTITWIGHASFLVQLGGANVLFDPVFSPRVSPVSFAGPKRAAALPLAIQDLPHVDVVAISHNHYDHLDRETVKRLAAQPGGSPLFVVPLGLKAWFANEGIARVEERDWWQSVDAGALRFTLVPVQHWSKRTLWDTNKTLWGGWVLEGAQLKLVHTGDLGYSRDPRDIGDKLGPFDLAMIPIGAYAPRWFMRPQHVDVEEAMQVRQDLRAARAVAMHWGTFLDLTDEPLTEPPQKLAALRAAAGLPVEAFDTMKIGETREIQPAIRPTPGGGTK
jgi:L-ascorbate metabolism protein UlaG (beta-lactamase superfamily)